MLAVALGYLKRGWCPIPIPFKSKRPNLNDWPNRRLSEADLVVHFNGTPQNIGIILGPASKGLVDIDLDVPEAVTLAPNFLPASACFGRKSRRRSHYLYQTDSSAPTKKFKDVNGAMLVEVRGDKQQTLFPPSTHPSGESVMWEVDTEPSRISGRDLLVHASKLAAAVIVGRHWPAAGSRQDAALALAGALLRVGWPVEEVSTFIHSVATVGGDEEAAKRADAAQFTARRMSQNLDVTGWPRLMTLIAPEAAKKAGEWLGLTLPEEETAKEANGKKQPPQAERLILRAETAALFKSPEGGLYATVPVGSHAQTWSIKSLNFRLWLVRRFYEEEQQPPSSQAVQTALSVLSCKAQFDGPTLNVHTRLAEHNGAIYLDLADEEWRAVEIRPDGWDVIPNPPVRFRRSRAMLPLPEPIRGGSLTDLKDFVNVGSHEDWVLLAGWLVAALRPKGPYPVLVLHGEQGSSKTTTAKLLRALVDPNEASVRSEPGDARDLMITAVNNWLVAFDNMSHLRSWLSDAICRLATGGGFATRELFTDSEEVIFDVQRPVLLNGIEEIVTRNDLLDRALIIYMPAISEAKRRSESELWADFNRRRPLLLGALLNVICDALRNLDSVKLDRLPRLADFALWATAAENSLGLRHGEFMNVYSGNRESANTLALEVSPVASAVILFMVSHDAWIGSVAELLGALSARVSDSTQRQSSWPKNPRALSNHLRRILPNLRAAGVSVTFTPKAHAGKRLIHLEKTEKFAPPSPPSQGI